MSGLDFALKPFSSEVFSPGLKIEGKVVRRASTLTLQYVLKGQMAELAIPLPLDAPSRKNCLWKEMCLEFFVANGDPKAGYWEFNVSPAGHWNVYRFFNDRKGMHEEPVFTARPFDITVNQDSLKVSLEVNLSSIVPLHCRLQLGISAVIEHKDGTLNYWALSHPGPQPDFHHHDSFCIDL
jgi:hypothetical protein